MKLLTNLFSKLNIVRLFCVPGGMDALVVSGLAGEGRRDVVFVARDDVHMNLMAGTLAFFSPGLECLEFPAWDCLPYDRVSPNCEIVTRRIDTLSRLLEPSPTAGRVILTTVSALMQRVVPRQFFDGATLYVAPGNRLEVESLIKTLGELGYSRCETVMEPGEFAVRGGIVDIFPGGRVDPIRVDFFGDEIESIRAFDALSQRTTSPVDGCILRPVSEVLLDDAKVSRFRSGYRALFGMPKGDDLLYNAVSDGRRYIGMEHWLTLFHEHMETLFDYVADATVVFDYQAEESAEARLELIEEYYQARAGVAVGGVAVKGAVYNPLPPTTMHLDDGEMDRLLAGWRVVFLSPFKVADGDGAINAGAKLGRNFTDVRVDRQASVFDSVCDHILAEQRAGRRVVITGYSKGSSRRLSALISEHGNLPMVAVANWQQAQSLAPSEVAVAVIGLEKGFTTADLALITEPDIIGERLNRPTRRRLRPENFITEASSIEEGDLVVHVDHGIARYDGLVAIEAGGVAHDCLALIYDGGDKLFLPVENIELISRYGSEQAGVRPDRLGGAAWQARKARLKRRIRDMADELIKIAAARSLGPGTKIVPQDGIFDEFCARFPYLETEDQKRAIDDSLGDLARGTPADRLICGDVGFGKTEVALRLAFATVMAGHQVALLVPTTLLCRQHYRNFKERFADFPVRVEWISRLVNAADTRKVKAGLKDGTVDIVIGTHALLAKDIDFRDLGLLVVDEEQHFGVAHKERLKNLKSDVHVFTLSATPIPRTLQLALSGVKDISLIATPPVDRMAVRTFILPFDPVIVREAIIRERFRGGQTFYVCPRIEDMGPVAKQLKELVPEISMVTAHGRMSANELERAMTDFCDGGVDLLLSTNIIESGLDMPSVNTIIVHRADIFGLAQLYQLRGRVGRSKIRAYAYLTLPPGKTISGAAKKRLEVMQTLDTLGAGFSLASHDLDIRGAGNLLGGEQSGHIREVGIELYQQMLEDAVAVARGTDVEAAKSAEWSPRIDIGMAVRIPETLVSDLSVRMSLYKRLAWISSEAEIEGFAAEMIDRFGSLPEEVENLLKTVAIKCLCKKAGVARVEAGPKGAVVSFRNDNFANPSGLVEFITKQAGTVSLRPDHKLVYRRNWETSKTRMEGVSYLTKRLAEIANKY